MKFDLKIEIEGTTLHQIEAMLHRLIGHCRKPARQLPFVFVGQGVSLMNLSLVPGAAAQQVNAVFCDNATPPVAHPLSGLPTCVDSAGLLTIAPIGTPTPADPIFSWGVSAPAGIAAGSNGTLTFSGTNPDGTTDSNTMAWSLAVLDDTQVILSTGPVA